MKPFDGISCQSPLVRPRKVPPPVPIAFVFPGQGSQRPALGAPWFDHDAWSVVADAEAATGESFDDLLLDPDRPVADTRSAQLCVFLASLMAWEAVRSDLDVDDVVAVAGHSLGQITALVAAGVTDRSDGARLAVARADACAAAQAERPGGLVALLGATDDQADAVCADLDGRAWVANRNGAGQLVVGAARDDLDAVIQAATAAGVRRARALPVDGAFHTPLLAPAVDRLRPHLEATSFTAPVWPVVTNHDAEPTTQGDGWPDRLTTHLVAPVRWDEVVHRLVALGADHIVEVGPGSTLTGLVRRIAPEVRTTNVAEPTDLGVVAP